MSDRQIAEILLGVAIGMVIGLTCRILGLSMPLTFGVLILAGVLYELYLDLFD